MTSRSRFIRRALRPAAILLIAVLVPAAVKAGETPATDTPKDEAVEEPRTVVVGKARLNWHLRPTASDKRIALVDAFRKATEAHLTGAEPPVTPKAEPVTLPGGQLQVPVPAELFHTLFVDADGRDYCSDSTVTAAPNAVRNADGEVR